MNDINMKNIFIDNERKSLRLRGYDYSQNGTYFITICADKMKCVFGRIVDGQMILNELGKVAKNEILNTEKIRKNIKIDAYVVMPNHVHFIVVVCRRDTMHSAPTVERFGFPTVNSIPTIIRGIKSAVTNRIKQNYNYPKIKIWQKNYYEHIIRDANGLNNIRNYIKNNPLKWRNSGLGKM